MEIHPDLIERCLKGDRKAENELYRSLYAFLLNVCRRYVRQDEQAREMLNIGFCRILLNISKYRNIAPFQFWAKKIMVNVLINEYRKEKVHYGNHQYVEDYNNDDQYSAINDAIDRFDVARVAMYIEKLPPASRQVFNLFIIDGYSHKEISAMLGISEGTSKWHLNASREKLKELLTEKKIKVEV